jgi:hypothetical protein
MAVENDAVLQGVVDFVSPGGYHVQNKFSWLCQFSSAQVEGVVVAAIVGQLEMLYDEIASRTTNAWDDPTVYVDEIKWIDGQWEVVANIGDDVVDTFFSNTSELLPLQTAPYMVARTARPRSRGRKWLPPFGEDQATSGVLLAGALTAIGNALVYYLGDIVITGGNTMTPGVPSTVTGTFLPFTTGLYGAIVGTQRRRRQGFGI